MNNPLRILCISPLFVPTADSEAFCGSKLIKKLVDSGIIVTVFSVDYEHSSSKIRRDDSQLWDQLTDLTIRIPPHSNRNRLFSIAWALKYQTAVWARWIGSVVHEAKILHKNRPFDVIYSRSLPTMAHVAGYWIAKSLKLPWIVNINDPWYANLTSDFGRSRKPLFSFVISLLWLKRVFRTADLITFPNTRLRDYHSRMAKITKKSEIIPHIGYSSNERSHGSEFLLVHAGKLGSIETTRQNTTLWLLRALSRFLKNHPEAQSMTKLILVGPEDTETKSLAVELGLESFLISTGIVSYEKSLGYINFATICILIEGKFLEGIFLPSKLADYIVARKPVLALSPRVGVVADMAKNKGIVRVDVDNEEAIEAAITKYYHAFKQGTLDELVPSEELVQKFEPNTVAELFCKQVREVLKV